MIERVRASLKKGMLIGWAAVLMASVLSAPSGHVSANDGQKQNPYPLGNPAHWAWQNRPDLPANLGQPKDWDDNAERQGWPVSRYPRRGDVAVFEPGVYGAGAGGHLVVVEQVYEGGAYRASYMDENDCGRPGSSTCGQVRQREYSVVDGVRFIHSKKDTRTTWSFASGSAGWTPYDLGAGNMGGPGWYYPLAGGDPRLVSPELDIPLNGYNAVEIDMVIGVPVTDPSIQVYFATEDGPTFTEERSVKLRGQADGALHRYTSGFGSNPAWKGKLVRLRLDPAGGGTVGGVRVDRIRLIYAEPEDEQAAVSYGLMSHDTTASSCRARRRP